ncbi:MAG: hypothetical protein RMK32_00195 [Anaerolineae bacterium]|nr:hypothetical protein [Thermoflexus sp.]MDW8064035.1 hypothetical protein [Anaerolineae bacterium]
MEDKRRELARRRRALNEGALRLLACLWPSPIALRTALLDPQGRLRPVVALMRAAPFQGLLRPTYNPARLALSFAFHGVAAFAVMTDARYYQGRMGHLMEVKRALFRQRINIPLICHDFFLDPFQVLEARAFGADAIWINLGILSPSALRDLLATAAKYRLEVLAEVRTETEIEAAWKAGLRVLIVQRRDWRTFEIDRALPAKLRPFLPDAAIRVVAGDISSPQEIEEARALGFHAVILEESLLGANDPVIQYHKLGFRS